MGTSRLTTAAANIRWSVALIDTFVRCGVRHAVISSGMRCSPLVLAAAHTLGLRTWTHIDERSAGFRGLGIGKQDRHPALVICTSGTAAANFFPSIIEARYSCVPLIVLTADRPPRLRGRGAPQTIDQVELFGHYPLLFRDCPVPGSDEAGLEQWREAAVTAVRHATGFPHGPVHLNLPFDEPLVPSPEDVTRIVAQYRQAMTTRPVQTTKDSTAQRHLPGAETWDGLAERIRQVRRGLIICGPQQTCNDLREQVARLSDRTGYPILADVSSQVRFGESVCERLICRYDFFLGSKQPHEPLSPVLVLHFGGLPTSKNLNRWLDRVAPVDHVVIDDRPDIADPYSRATATISCPLDIACSELTRRLDPSPTPANEFVESWRREERRTQQILQSVVGSRTTIVEGDIVATVFSQAPAGTIVYLSNSMPIRLADAYAGAVNHPLRVLVNRGVNGIDGVVSSAVGAAAAQGKTVVLVIGDMALLHDLNGLLGTSSEDLNLKIVLLNNNGGEIFSFLPIAGHGDCYESLVVMPHGREFSHVARFHDLPYQRVTTIDEFCTAFAAGLSRAGTEILEVTTDRHTTLEISREVSLRLENRRTV